MILDYILRRLGLLLFMLLMLSIFTFSLAYLFPGDPLSNLSGVPSNNFSQNTQLEDKYFYNSNYFMQYLAFLGRVFQGDWGLSFASGDNVFSHILDLLPATLELSVYALIVSIFVGVPAGIIGSAYYNRWPDKLINSTTIVGYSMPVFWLALLLIMIFSLKLGWFPMSGRMGLLYEIPAASGFMLIDIMLAGFPYKGMAFVDALHHLTLPTIVLATYPTTVLVRFTRESMLKIMDQNFINCSVPTRVTFFDGSRVPSMLSCGDGFTLVVSGERKGGRSHERPSKGLGGLKTTDTRSRVCKRQKESERERNRDRDRDT